MAKQKIHELAKELNKSSKEVMEVLGKNGIEVKSHMSALEDSQVEMVKKAFAPKAEAPKAEEKKPRKRRKRKKSSRFTIPRTAAAA